MASTTSKTKPRPANKPMPQAAEPLVKTEGTVVPAPMNLPVLASDDFRAEAPEMLSNSEVYDEADQAQWIQLAEQSSFRERARLANAPETHPDFDGKHCVECGEEIPKDRLALFKVRCVECQRALEAHRRQFAR